MEVISKQSDFKSDFDLIKTLAQGVEVVARKSDGERFVPHPFYQEQDVGRDKLNQLFARGAGEAVLNLLNHENLVSITTVTTDKPLTGPGNAPRSNRLLWDYCDAGTLEQLLENLLMERMPDEKGFLPESLVWHVGISVLRALQWLHEGVRDTYETVSKEREGEQYAGKARESRSAVEPEKDWLPVMHRAVHESNIFFQLPRGIETYGTCKIGNFSHCYVSGNVSSKDGPLVIPLKAEPDMPIETMRARWAEWREKRLDMAPELRPTTRGCELYDLGTILFRMMSGVSHPDPEECSFCGCRHFDTFGPACDHRACPWWQESGNWLPGYQVEKRTMYTRELRRFVTDLLGQWRTNGRASTLLDRHWQGYLYWMQETPDGRQYKDVFDDIQWRKANTNLKQMADLRVARETLGIDIEGVLIV
ncbi:hypothetical protein GQ53DRAFT_382146 [Thozetella sp. PMI_491]|nr:hypothetical protein GQ53DRAFT_382146 [Thozetella sp. PMI_491]